MSVGNYRLPIDLAINLIKEVSNSKLILLLNPTYIVLFQIYIMVYIENGVLLMHTLEGVSIFANYHCL